MSETEKTEVVSSFVPVEIKICDTHRRDNWMTHENYLQEEGAIKCRFCPWGSRVEGYYRVRNGKVVDLRSGVSE